MKCLTVKRPWGAAILTAGKDVENRSWRTNYRGDLLIHQGRSVDNRPGAERWMSLELAGETCAGQILGVVRLGDCVRREHCQLPWAMGPDHHWCWLLAGPVRIFRNPIPWIGQQGLYEVPADVVRDALDQAETRAQRETRQWREAHHAGMMAESERRGAS